MLAIAAGALVRLETGSLCYFHIGMAWLVCPIGFLEICLNSRSVYWDLLPFALLGIVPRSSSGPGVLFLGVSRGFRG